jgi:integrase
MSMVRVETIKNRVRLRWTYGGRRFCLAISNNNSNPDTLRAAKLKAATIERDILFDNFDISLTRYRQEKLKTALDIWEMYATFKRPKVTPVTQINLHCVQLRLSKWKGALESTEEAERFMQAQADIKPITLRKYLCYLNAAWELARERGLIRNNPWKGVKVKVPPQQRVKPFSEVEVKAIIGGFENNHYSDFVVFLFGTGLRFGEAAGLRWGAVAEDCSSIWVGEIMTNGVRRPTKTNRDRTVPLSEGLRALLLSHRPINAKPDNLVFTSPEGGAIDNHNFRNRIWVKILTELGIPYRKPYTTRATFISLALAKGTNPVTLSAITGHNVSTMFAHYVGVVGGLDMPDVLALPSPESRKGACTQA